MKNAMKKLLSVALVSTFIISSSQTYVSAKSMEDVTVKIEKISENEEKITVTKVVDSIKSSEELEAYMAEYFEDIQIPGIETGEAVVQTYDDGSKLILVVEETNNNSLTRASQEANKKFNFYYENILGIRTLGFEVNISTSYFDGKSGYIYNMEGSWKKHNGNFTLSWDKDGKKAEDYLHALALDSQRGTEKGYHIFISSYTPLTGKLSISAY